MVILAVSYISTRKFSWCRFVTVSLHLLPSFLLVYLQMLCTPVLENLQVAAFIYSVYGAVLYTYTVCADTSVKNNTGIHDPPFFVSDSRVEQQAEI